MVKGWGGHRRLPGLCLGVRSVKVAGRAGLVCGKCRFVAELRAVGAGGTGGQGGTCPLGEAERAGTAQVGEEKAQGGFITWGGGGGGWSRWTPGGPCKPRPFCDSVMNYCGCERTCGMCGNNSTKKPFLVCF